MEAVAVVTSVITIVDAVANSYKTIEKIRGLPRAFDEVKRHLPLVKKTLEDAKNRLQTSRLGEVEGSGPVVETIRHCDDKAKALKQVFDELERKCKEDRDAAKTWTRARAWYREALRGMKTHRVESLMGDLLGHVKALATNEIFSLHDDVDNITKALKELSRVDASLDDTEFEAGAIHAHQTNESGATGMQNNTQGGSHTFNSGNNFSGAIGTLNWVSYHNSDPGLDLRGPGANIGENRSHDGLSVHNSRLSEKSQPRMGLRHQFLRSSVWDSVRHRLSPSSIARMTKLGGTPGYRVCHYIPLPKNNRFVGRTDALNALQTMLLKARRERVALVGLGGVGKTQTALNIAHWTKEKMSGCSVFWMSALSTESFDQTCGEIAAKIGIQVAGGAESKKALQRYLSSDEAGAWLLIVDNADDIDALIQPGGIRSYLPRRDNGQIPFTTRSADVAAAVAGTNTHKLTAMNEEEAKCLLERLISRERLLQDMSMVTELLEELTYLPLAINHAAAYLERNDISIAKYLELMRHSEQQLVDLLSREFADSNLYEGPQTSVATTWLISFERIQQSDPLAAKLLSFLSQIEPKAIPRSILPKFETEEQLVSAIGTLVGYAFLANRNGDQMFDMHSLVHLAAGVWIKRQGTLKQEIEAAVVQLDGVFPTSDDENRPQWREYMPHSFRLLKASEEAGLEIDEVCDLGIRTGQCLYSDGRYHEALGVLQCVVEVSERTLDEEHPDRLFALVQLALVHMTLATNRGKTAVEILRYVVEVQKRTRPREDAALLRWQSFLATAYASVGRQKDAIKLLKHAVKIQERTIKESDEDLLRSQRLLALEYLNDGQAEAAISILEHVISVRKAIQGQNNTSTGLLHAKGYIAGAYSAVGRHKEAIEILEHVVDMQDKVLGNKEHPAQLVSMCSLGREYYIERRYEDAIGLLEFVVGAYEKAVEADHGGRLGAEDLLAMAYVDSGRSREKGLKLLEHVVGMRKTFGEEDRCLLASQHNLARAYMSDTRTKEMGIELMKHVIKVRRRTLGEDHPRTVASRKLLARARS